jgi:hypothetical protein
MTVADVTSTNTTLTTEPLTTSTKPLTIGNYVPFYLRQ